MACNYWVSNSFTSFNDNRLPAETTFPSITKAGRLNILYSMISINLPLYQSGITS